MTENKRCAWQYILSTVLLSGLVTAHPSRRRSPFTLRTCQRKLLDNRQNLRWRSATRTSSTASSIASDTRPDPSRKGNWILHLSLTEGKAFLPRLTVRPLGRAKAGALAFMSSAHCQRFTRAPAPHPEVKRKRRIFPSLFLQFCVSSLICRCLQREATNLHSTLFHSEQKKEICSS